MAQRPTIKKPTPLSQPADPVMGGVNIPKFSAEMQAEVSPEAAPLWNFVLTHARKIAAGVVVVVVAILAVACWQWYREGQVADERFALGRITSIQDPARRAAALDVMNDFPFWRGEHPFRQMLAPCYEQAAIFAGEILTGEKKKPVGRPRKLI